MTGKVYLVGAGPGDPELLTLKALKLLKSSDVVLHDDLIGAEILAFIPSSTPVQNVGKRFGRKKISQHEINALLVQNAMLGLQVVRLKSGDPLIFGRAGEEIEALRTAQIEFEIVPGVTAALGAAAQAQIPLTHRQVSSALVLVTGHHAGADEFADWPAKIPTDATVVVYMPGYDYPSTAQQLLRAGLPGTTPCAIISQATSPAEQVHVTTVEDLHRSPRLPAPTLLVVGEVVRLAKPAALHRQFVWRGDAPGLFGGEIGFDGNGSVSPAGQERAE
jgi:uroporphyrin-III C-methyltransferase